METYYKELARLEKWKRLLSEIELDLKIHFDNYYGRCLKPESKYKNSNDWWRHNGHKMNNLRQKIYNYENLYLVNTYTDFILESYSKNYKEDFKVEF